MHAQQANTAAPSVDTAASGGTEPHLVIGTHAAPPFVAQRSDGGWYGISIDLLNEIADEVGFTYKLVDLDKDELVASVASGKIDAAIGAVPINGKDETRIDFTQPYYHSGIGVAVHDANPVELAFIFKLMTSPAFLSTISLLIGPVFFFGALIWLLERRANPQQFEHRPGRGVFSGFWWATVTMTTVGYGDKAPVTFLGRLLAMAWMFIALLLASVTTAQLAAGLTSSMRETVVAGLGDLGHVRVGTVSGSPAEVALKALSIPASGFDNVDAGLSALSAHKIDAFAYDKPVLDWVTQSRSGLKVSDIVFSEESYGLILPQKDALREPIDVAILNLLDTKQWDLVLKRYMPDLSD
ncbi:transporter substrate-binding domain-containing protein [Martelella alba]|uniref:transporter substrate-binding domain-containing protein n=1 Tax=Martelella alba TaxID=2590451 RepID=UPI0015E846B2|nr:transporter substrate-binding domain-containing protein [Martelella alba]